MSIESILNSQYPVVSGGQPIPQSIGGDVAGEIARAQQLGYTDDQIASAIGGLMAGKATLTGNLSAWHALSAEFGPAAIGALFPDQGGSGGTSPGSAQNPLDGANVDEAQRRQAFYGIDKANHRIEDGDYEFARTALLAASKAVPTGGTPGAPDGVERRRAAQLATGRRGAKAPAGGGLAHVG